MNQHDASGTSGEDEGGDTMRQLAERGSEYAPTSPGGVGRIVTSGTAAAVGAGAAFVSGVRAIRRGDGQGGFARLVGSGALALLALSQRRSSPGPTDVEETDVVDTAPDLEGVDTGPEVNVDDPDTNVESEAGSVDQSDVVDTGVGAEGSTEGGPGDVATAADESGDATVDAQDDYERLGAAAFDEQSGRVPAPQEAFDRGLLSSGAELFWGVDESGNFVVVTVEYDTIEETDGFSYVASSEVDDDERDVRVPASVLDHWDDVAGGGEAVTSGTDLVFVLSDDLWEEGLLVVVPEQWSDELLE